MSFVKNFLVKAAFGAVLLAALPAYAQDQAQDVRIAVVNIPILLDRAPQTRAATAELTNDFAPREREYNAKLRELEELTTKIQQDAAVMGEAERDSAEQQYRELQREVARLQNDLQEDLNLRRNEMIGELQTIVIREVQTYAEAQGYDLVIAEGYVFASEAVNITEEVLIAIETNYQAENSQ